MNNQYSTITKMQLVKIFNLMIPAFENNNHNKLINTWETFITTFANDNIIFSNSSNADDFDETFSKDFTFSNISFNFQFDIFRIIKNISKSELNYAEISSINISKDLSYSLIDVSNHTLKEENPIVVFFPISNDIKYLAIDGNHRINNFESKNEIYNINLIFPTDLSILYFKNLNSFIAYHLLTSYYSSIYMTDDNFNNYVNELYKLLSITSNYLSRIIKR